MVFEPAVFAQAVDDIYDVAEHPDALPRALAAVGRCAGVSGVHLLVLERSGTRLLVTAPPEGGERTRYSPSWCNDEAALSLRRQAEQHVFNLRTMAPGCTLPWPGALAAVLPSPLPDRETTMLVAPVEDTTEQACAAVAAQLRLLVSHLARAILFSRRLHDDSPTLSATARLLAELPMPCLLTDSAGRCIEANQAFTKLQDNLSVQLVAGRLRFEDEYLQDSWQSALHETADTAVGRTLLADPGKGRQWKIHVQAVRCITLGGHPQHLLLAVCEEQGGMPYADPERLSSVGKLTPAELDVLAGLLQGFTGKVIARSRNASVNTVRTQIMSILTKTGHRSQKELIAAFGASTFDPSSLQSPGDPDD